MIALDAAPEEAPINTTLPDIRDAVRRKRVHRLQECHSLLGGERRLLYVADGDAREPPMR